MNAPSGYNLTPEALMDAQITASMSGVITYLTLVDKKIQSLLKLQEDNRHILSELSSRSRSLRATLTSLTTSMRKPNFDKTILSTVKTPTNSLFQYLSTVLLSAIAGLRKLETQLKRAKPSSGGIFKSRSREASPSVDHQLASYAARLQHFELSISVGVHIIECELSTATTKKLLHLHDVKTHLSVLAGTLDQLQTVNEKVRAATLLDGAGELNSIYLIASELTTIVLAETDKEMNKVHSGFVPMSPLVEVMTRNTLYKTSTITSVLELSA